MGQKKTHLYRSHGDYRSAGQTQYEYTHSTACGYVRGSVSNYLPLVTCKHCLRTIEKQPNTPITAHQGPAHHGVGLSTIQPKPPA